jgi:hypothetical protein
MTYYVCDEHCKFNEIMQCFTVNVEEITFDAFRELCVEAVRACKNKDKKDKVFTVTLTKEEAKYCFRDEQVLSKLIDTIIKECINHVYGKHY